MNKKLLTIFILLFCVQFSCQLAQAVEIAFRGLNSFGESYGWVVEIISPEPVDLVRPMEEEEDAIPVLGKSIEPLPNPEVKPVQSRKKPAGSTWRLIGLTQLSGSLGWVVELDKSSTDPEYESSVLQELKLSPQGYIYHPYLADISGNLQLTQKSGSGSEFDLIAGSLKAAIFKKKPLVGLIDLGKKNIEYEPVFYPPYTVAQRYYQLTLLHNVSSLPGRINYRKSWNEALDAPNPYSTKEETVRFEASREFTRDIKGHLEYQANQVDEFLSGRSEQRQELRITNSAQFLYDLIRLDTTYYTSRQDGNYSLESELLTAKGTVQHSANISSNYRFRLENQDYAHSTWPQQELSAGAGAKWQITPDVRLYVDADGTRSEEQGIYKELNRRWGVEVEKPLGQTTLLAGYEFLTQNRESSGGTFHFRESLTLRPGAMVPLSQRGILPGTIRVYQAESPYLEYQVGDYQIQIISPEIIYMKWLLPDEVRAVVEYDFTREPELQDTWSNIVSLGVRRSFTNGLFVSGATQYVSRLTSCGQSEERPLKELRLAGELSFTKGPFKSSLTAINSTTEDRYAVRLGWKSRGWAADLEHRQISNDFVYKTTEGRLAYNFPLWSRGYGQWGTAYTLAQNELDQRTQYFSTHLQVKQDFTQHLSGTIRAGYRSSSIRAMLDTFNLKYGLDYRRGQLSLDFGGQYDRNLRTDFSIQKYRLGLTRYF